MATDVGVRVFFMFLLRMIVSRESLSPPASQPAALKARVDPFLATPPQPAIRLDERVHFTVREFEPPLAQQCESRVRPLEKLGAELLVRQNLSDDVLYASLRHRFPFPSRVPRSGTTVLRDAR
jgi:hypothetical protein